MLLNYTPSKIWIVLACFMVHCVSDGLVAIQISEGGVANQYIGCYYDEGNRSNWTVGFSQNSSLSIKRCLERCRNLNRTYAILQRGEDCLCGDIFNSSISNDLCNVTCSGNSSEHCGGSKMGLQYSIFYAVCPIGRYLADCSGVCHCKNQIPCNLLTGECPNGCEGNWTNNKCNEESTFVGRYIGCYKDANDRALNDWDVNRHFRSQNPIRECSMYCAEKKTTYAGLQAEKFCLCGENYRRYGKAEESSCKSKCSGNENQICGGNWRNSVYSVCVAGRFGTECLDICNCRSREVCNNLNGRCTSGCKPGWTGDSCSVRNCSSNNGDCSENETCVTVNLGSASVSRCACSSGYGRDTLRDKCRDLDECSLSSSVCDNETQTCHNTIGGFNCICNSKFERIDLNGNCRDLDECSLSPGVCDNETETCHNTIGGFNCICNSGFQRFVHNGKCQGGVANQYIGCYYDEGNRPNWTVGFSQNDNLRINRCLQRCRNLNRTYAILQHGEDCLCGDSFNSSISNDLCNVTCSGNSSEYCGGSKMGLQYSIFYAVCPIGRYLANCSGVCHCNNQVPCNLLTGECPNDCEGNWTNSNCSEESTFIGRYIGCYNDGNPRALNIWNDKHHFRSKNPILECSRYCAANKTTYAGLQASEYCLCGENYGRYGKVEERSCDRQCTGNSRQICGGRNLINSVYSVCAVGRFGTECLDICNCRDGEVCNILNGSCKSGCKPGWTGDSCSVRNCSSNNGECLENETCVKVNLGYASVSRCACSSGYGRDTLWEKCIDLDECSLSLSSCDKETATCHNTIGGFNCTCNSGFERIDHNGNCRAVKPNSDAGGGLIVAVFFIIALVAVIAVIGVFIYRRRLKGTEPEKHNEHGNAFSSNKRGNTKEENVNNKQVEFEGNHTEYECPYYSFDSKETRIKIECLADVVERLNEYPGDLQKEFKSVAEYSGAPCNVGKRKELKQKNRFKNILPYDHNRVILSKKENQDNSDYINASHITGYQKSDKLIASQGPTTDSVDDFWRMIFEKHVTVIVMMTNIEEKGKIKCQKYWPDAGEVMTFEDITVSFVSDQKWHNFERRLLLAKRNSETLEVTQWHYTSWPDHGVPQDARAILTFRRKVRNSMSSDSSTIIHCSAGAGRTGSYIAVDYLIEEAKTGYVDVLGCLRALREQRTQMIQTVEQYRIVYAALLEHLRTGDTAMGRDSYERRLGELRTKDQLSAKTKLAIQFEMLNHDQQKHVNAENKTNDMENSATFWVQGSRTSNNYVIKSVSLSEKPDEFWKWQIDESSKLIIFINEGQNELQFVPTPTKPVALSEFTLTIDSMTEEEHVTVCNIKLLQESLYANDAGASESCKMMLLNVRARPSPDRDSFNHESILEVYSIVKKHSQTLNNDTINVISLNDERLGAFCVAAFNAFDMITEEKEVDIYQIVHDLRMTNSNFVSTLNAYEELHNSVKLFIQRYYSTELYQDIL